MVEGRAIGGVQAQGVAPVQEHAPMKVSQTGPSRANKLMLDNFPDINGIGRVLLYQSLMLHRFNLLQLRKDSGLAHLNLMKAYAGCGYKCPIRQCFLISSTESKHLQAIPGTGQSRSPALTDW